LADSEPRLLLISDCALHAVDAGASSDPTGQRGRVVIGTQEGSRTWESVIGGECDVTCHFKEEACDKMNSPEPTETMTLSFALRA